MIFGRWKRRCTECGHWTPRSWWVPAGGLCGECLADDALPLVRLVPAPPEPPELDW